MAHREQHGNRETKKPKKDKPKAEAHSTIRGVVSDTFAAKADAKQYPR